jgi:flagellar assembly factor FliW
MPLLQTKNFGSVPYNPDSLVEFPRGLPGFEDRHRFVPLHFPDTDPLVFLQSIENPELCFVTLPILAIDPT